MTALRTETLGAPPAQCCGALGCVPLEAPEALPVPAVIKTRRSRATLRLTDSATLELGERTEVELTDDGGRWAALRAGQVTLRLAAQGGRDLRWQLADRALALESREPSAITLTAVRADRVEADVAEGRIYLRTGAGAAVELQAGQIAKIVAGHPVDLRFAQPDTRPAAGLSAPGGAGGSPREQAYAGPPRGLGRMTARLPGTEKEISGVRLVSHQVRASIRDGFARTEVVEEFYNDTDRVLEGRYVFPLPPDASISRLALWVGDELVEGEMLERRRAARIFKGIVDDTVRPRDPALLEWVRGSELSLKIFPILPGKSRRVLLAYNQTLPLEGTRLSYRYPLALGSDQATEIDDFSLLVTAEDSARGPADVRTPDYAADIRYEPDHAQVSFSAKDYVPAGDFVVSYRVADPAAELRTAVYLPSSSTPETEQLVERSRGALESAYVALSLRVVLPPGAPQPGFRRLDRSFVLDTSQSQSRESLAAQTAIVAGLLERMDPDEQFVLLACDSACESYPAEGRKPARRAHIDEAVRWLEGRAPGGASDIAGALVAAAGRLRPDGSGQVVYLGDGAATAGDLDADRIARRVADKLAEGRIDLRLIGLGRSVDEVRLGNLAALVGGGYQALDPTVAPAVRIRQLARALRAPLIIRPKLELPAGVEAVHPSRLPNLRLGQDVTVLAQLKQTGGGEVVLRGELEGRPYRLTRTLGSASFAQKNNPLVPRLWAERRIFELQRSDEEDAVREAVQLSVRHHVMSRHTALLVLENESMFREFGILRTQRRKNERRSQSDAARLGMIGLLRRSDTTDAAPVSSAGSTWGQKLGEPLGQSPGQRFGAGGLGLSGSSQGGGGKGTGIGLGSIGTIGHGAGTGTGQGFGSGSGRLGRSHRTRPPRVRMGAAGVSGRLPPEVIQRIVRQGFGRYRLCYERGLRTNPNLQGRVVVRFVIGRDGRVSNVSGGGDMPDSAVVSCVTRAFYGLTFPQPEGGVVTVSYPLSFVPGGGGSAGSAQPTSPPLHGWTPQPSAVHAPADDSWRHQGEERLARLRAALDSSPESRQSHEALIRGYLRGGRFKEALAAAEHFAELDPDRLAAQELLSYAAAANGKGELAARTVASMVELEPRSAARQRRAARAFEALGDERRACAHWRAAAQLSTDSDVHYEALRCRARADGERERVAAEVQAMEQPTQRLQALEAADQIAAYDGGDGRPGWFHARLRCEGASCPAVIIVGPDGSVYSPWTPSGARSDALQAAVARRRAGIYRTLIYGTGAADLELYADGAQRRLALQSAPSPGPRTVAMTQVYP